MTYLIRIFIITWFFSCGFGQNRNMTKEKYLEEANKNHTSCANIILKDNKELKQVKLYQPKVVEGDNEDNYTITYDDPPGGYNHNQKLKLKDIQRIKWFNNINGDWVTFSSNLNLSLFKPTQPTDSELKNSFQSRSISKKQIGGGSIVILKQYFDTILDKQIRLLNKLYAANELTKTGYVFYREYIKEKSTKEYLEWLLPKYYLRDLATNEYLDLDQLIQKFSEIFQYVNEVNICAAKLQNGLNEYDSVERKQGIVDQRIAEAERELNKNIYYYNNEVVKYNNEEKNYNNVVTKINSNTNNNNYQATGDIIKNKLYELDKKIIKVKKQIFDDTMNIMGQKKDLQLKKQNFYKRQKKQNFYKRQKNALNNDYIFYIENLETNKTSLVKGFTECDWIKADDDIPSDGEAWGHLGRSAINSIKKFFNSNSPIKIQNNSRPIGTDPYNPNNYSSKDTSFRARSARINAALESLRNEIYNVSSSIKKKYKNIETNTNLIKYYKQERNKIAKIPRAIFNSKNTLHYTQSKLNKYKSTCDNFRSEIEDKQNQYENYDEILNNIHESKVESVQHRAALLGKTIYRTIWNDQMGYVPWHKIDAKKLINIFSTQGENLRDHGMYLISKFKKRLNQDNPEPMDELVKEYIAYILDLSKKENFDTLGIIINRINNILKAYKAQIKQNNALKRLKTVTKNYEHNKSNFRHTLTRDPQRLKTCINNTKNELGKNFKFPPRSIDVDNSDKAIITEIQNILKNHNIIYHYKKKGDNNEPYNLNKTYTDITKTYSNLFPNEDEKDEFFDDTFKNKAETFYLYDELRELKEKFNAEIDEKNDDADLMEDIFSENVLSSFSKDDKVKYMMFSLMKDTLKLTTEGLDDTTKLAAEKLQEVLNNKHLWNYLYSFIKDDMESGNRFVQAFRRNFGINNNNNNQDDKIEKLKMNDYINLGINLGLFLPGGAGIKNILSKTAKKFKNIIPSFHKNNFKREAIFATTPTKFKPTVVDNNQLNQKLGIYNSTTVSIPTRHKVDTPKLFKEDKLPDVQFNIMPKVTSKLANDLPETTEKIFANRLLFQFYQDLKILKTKPSLQRMTRDSGLLDVNYTPRKIIGKHWEYTLTRQGYNRYTIRDITQRIPRIGGRNLNFRPRQITEISIKDLNFLHAAPRPQVPRNHIENLMFKIKYQGYRLERAVPIVRLPNRTLVLMGGHHRTLAMETLNKSMLGHKGSIPARIVDWKNYSIPERLKALSNPHWGKTLQEYLGQN